MEKYYKSYDEIPEFLTMEEVAKLLRISRSAAYQLAHCDGFPVIHLLEKRLVVNKKDLFDWLASQRLPLSV